MPKTDVTHTQTVDENDLIHYILQNKGKHTLTYEAVRFVLDSEIEYLCEQGLIEKQ